MTLQFIENQISIEKNPRTHFLYPIHLILTHFSDKQEKSDYD